MQARMHNAQPAGKSCAAHLLFGVLATPPGPASHTLRRAPASTAQARELHGRGHERCHDAPPLAPQLHHPLQQCFDCLVC